MGQTFNIHFRSSFIQWPLPSIPQSTPNTHNAELIRNQLDELKKKMTPIRQIVASLQAQQKYSLLQYIPNFDSYNYDNSIDDDDDDDDADLSAFAETYGDDDFQESFSERLYKEMDGQNTRIYFIFDLFSIRHLPIYFIQVSRLLQARTILKRKLSAIVIR